MTAEDRLLDAIYNIRGRVIQRAVEIESVIDIYIAEHFTKDPDKLHEFVSLITSRTTFDNKLQMFKFLVDKHNKDFVGGFRTYHNEIKKAMEWRNVIAHYPVPFNKNSIEAFDKERIVLFVKLKSTSGFIEISEDFINKLLGEMMELFNRLKILISIDTTSPPV
jgi:hypothetical protein